MGERMETPASRTIIVLRFSAMGDVALLAAVLQEVVQQNPSVKIVMVSRPLFEAFFLHIPQIIFHGMDTKGVHKGVKGLHRLSKELQQYNADAIADVHENLRSKTISFFCKKKGLQISQIDKGRAEKKALTRKKNKVLVPLKTTAQRYADVFTQLGLSVQLSNQLKKSSHEISPTMAALLGPTNNKKIGVSPFAQHQYKMYPLEKMEVVVKSLTAKGYDVFIFGGGEKEKEVAEKWALASDQVTSMIGKINLKEELDLISALDLMISMDSAGMHLASLVGTTVVSIWGPTHPYAGFLGYGQKLENCVQVSHPIRPNSIYGNKPCFAEGTTCIELVTVEMILEKVEENLKQPS